jgi:hypothetical protein
VASALLLVAVSAGGTGHAIDGHIPDMRPSISNTCEREIELPSDLLMDIN